MALRVSTTGQSNGETASSIPAEFSTFRGYSINESEFGFGFGESCVNPVSLACHVSDEC